MKSMIGLSLVFMLAFFPRPAMAKDFCLSFNPSGLVIFKSFVVPAQGTCQPVIAFLPTPPGIVARGGSCTTSDGKTLLFTAFAGLSEGLFSIQGTINLSNKSGTANLCQATAINPGANPTACTGFSITAGTCPTKEPISGDP